MKYFMKNVVRFFFCRGEKLFALLAKLLGSSARAKDFSPLQGKMVCIIGALLLSISFVAQAAEKPNKVLDIQHWTTKKGIPVYFVQTKQVPMLVVQVAFDAGSARDGVLPGTAILLNNMFDQGNAGLTATQMAEGFDNIGAEYAHWVSRDMSVVQLKTVTENKPFHSALNYFTKIFQPDFPKEAFDREKSLQKIAITQQEESPNVVNQKALLQAIYPQHPYGNPVLGLEDSIEKMQLSDMKNFYQTYYVAPNAVISMAGAINLKTAKQIAEQITQFIPEGKKAEPLPEAPFTEKAVRTNISYDSSQTVISVGQVGITYGDPDYFPLMVGNYTLGGGTLVSQLSNEIREKRGLTYGVQSYFAPMMARGPFIITLATRTEKADEALRLTQTVLKNFVQKGPSPSELRAAKRFIKGNFPLRFETNSDIADALISIGFYQLPLDRLDTYLSHIDTVTTGQIQKAFQKHIRPGQMVVVTVGKSSKRI